MVNTNKPRLALIPVAIEKRGANVAQVLTSPPMMPAITGSRPCG